jgi:non-ribosomal peptide synthetase component E (peptide arylation enzyme)
MVNEDSQKLREDIARLMPLMTAADWCDLNSRKLGDKEALVDRRQRLNWTQVKELSDKLAWAFGRLGLEPNSPLLVQLPNSVELFLVRLACETAGLRLITVAAAFRAAELTPIVQLTRPEAAIIPREYRSFDHYELIQKIRNPELKHILIVGPDVPENAMSLEEAFRAEPNPSQVAQRLQKVRHSVIDVCQIGTTSGSTGIPKCVEVPLYTRLLTGWIHSKRFRIDSSDTLAASTPIITGTADALVYNGGCQLGARIVLIDHFTPAEACDTLAAEQVTVIPLVPTMLARILLLPDLSNYKLALRCVVNHGSILPLSQGLEAERRLSCRIMQGYGSVDCGGIGATYWDDPAEIRLGTVGRPLDGTVIRIVDPQGRDVARGDVGRLLVKGLNTNAHFFRNPQLNAVRRQGGFFDLQELVRMDDGGNLVLMGRQQDLIIRGGQNIYPADVEAVLVQHPKISEACVIGVPDQEMGERVCVVVVCRPDENITISEVTSFLETAGLARFKWPERLEVVSSLPKVASAHKIDKNKLKQSLGF